MLSRLSSLGSSDATEYFLTNYAEVVARLVKDPRCRFSFLDLENEFPEATENELSGMTIFHKRMFRERRRTPMALYAISFLMEVIIFARIFALRKCSNLIERGVVRGVYSRLAVSIFEKGSVLVVEALKDGMNFEVKTDKERSDAVKAVSERISTCCRCLNV